MTENEQKIKMFELFNTEQGVFIYYTCGLLVAMIGYCFDLVMATDKNYLIIPLLGIFMMFVSLGFGIYFIKHRLSNYYNNGNLLDEREKAKDPIIKDFCKKLIEKNSNTQAFWYKLHWWSFVIGPLIMFIWLLIVTL